MSAHLLNLLVCIYIMKSTVYYTVRRKKTNKRKKNKRSRKSKKVKKSKMIIKKQKGGEFTERPSYTFLEDSEGRFEFNNLNSKINRIIDKKYNNQYLFEKKTQQKNDLTQKKKGGRKTKFLRISGTYRKLLCF